MSPMHLGAGCRRRIDAATSAALIEGSRPREEERRWEDGEEERRALWQPGYHRIPPIPEKGPGKLPRYYFGPFEAHEAGFPPNRETPGKEPDLSRSEIFPSDPRFLAKRRPRAGAAVPPPPARRATTGLFLRREG